MAPFTKITLDNREYKAFFFALFFTFLFIALLSLVFPPSLRKKKRLEINHLTSAPPVAPEPPPFVDLNERFRVVPQNFKHIDFKNHSYVIYNSLGVGTEITLHDGKRRLPYLGSFELKDVYYKDITRDRVPEAIVRLSQVKCSGSCDGGADLFYIYSMRDKLTPIWRYQTGSRAYGCSLKFLKVGDAQLRLELFGRCPTQATDNPSFGKFVVKDLTFIRFEFDGKRFVQDTIEEFTTASPMNVKNYEPSILLF